MPGQPAPEPPPLQTLETRLVRIEAMLENIQDRLHSTNIMLNNIQDAVTLDAYGLFSNLLQDIRGMLANGIDRP